MGYLEIYSGKELDINPIGRVDIDFNPVDNNKPLEESRVFNKYAGGSPANIAAGMSSLGKKVGFISKANKRPVKNPVR